MMNNLPIKIACGYNPGFKTHAIQIPSEVSLIEHGYGVNLNQYENLTFSLHINRSPITESIKAQDLWFKRLESLNLSWHQFISIGLHLIGNRSENIGKFGLSSHYTPSKQAEKLASRFITQLQSIFGVEIWLENANFYSKSVSNIRDSIESLNYLSAINQAFIICDLSHLLINCKNIQLEPFRMLECFSWRQIKELHLSGVYVDREGVYHDCHSKPVYSDVWNMLDYAAEHCFTHFIKDNLYINLEHADINWTNNSEDYYHDFALLQKKINAYCENKKQDHDNYVTNEANKYASHYIYSMLKKMEFPMEYFDEWMTNLHQSNESLILYAPEKNLYNGVLFYESYKKFLENRN